MDENRKTPLVSIIMPVYNASRFLREAVDSVLGQSYRNFEFLAVDDGSKDNSLALLQSYSDPRMRVITQMNQGANVARNLGLTESKGEYIKFVDADDLLYPDALAQQVEQMLTLGANEEVFGDFDFIDENGKVFYHSVFTEQMLRELNANQDYWLMKHWDIITSCPLHRRENLLKVGGFNVMLKDNQEKMLHIALSLSGVKFVYHPVVVYAYRSFQSADRISCKRMKEVPDLSGSVFYYTRLLQLIAARYGTGFRKMTTLVSDGYFSLADKYFLAGKTAEGRYCLSQSFAVPHYRKHPRYCRNYWLALVYICLGHIVGFHRSALWMKGLTTRTGVRPDKNPKTAMLLHAPVQVG